MQRISHISKELSKHKVSAFLTTKGPNLQYLTGFTGGEGLALVFDNQKTVLLVDGRYTYQAKTQAFPFVDVQEYQPKNLWNTIESYLKDADAIGLEADARLNLYFKLNEQLPKKDWKMVPDFFELIRAVKDEDELECIKKAASIANQAYLNLLHHVKPGVSELELSALLEYEMKKLGGQKVSFEVIVASGNRSAMPHGVASEKKIEANELITFDFGVFYQGYASDTTRTIAVGQPKDPEAQKVYQTVLDAQKKSIDVLREGALCSQADEIPRNYIEEQGYGAFFKHSTGHGIGLEIHELPRISYDCKMELKAGMVVTVEPGIYLDERFGVRIEDSLIITKDGCINLTPIEKDRLVIL